MLALFDLGSEVNAIYPTFAKELGLSIRPTEIRVQKIDATMFDTYEMVVAAFSIFKIPFLILSDAKVDFSD